MHSWHEGATSSLGPGTDNVAGEKRAASVKMDLKAVVLSILVLFLCSEVSGYHKQKREAEEGQLTNPFSWIQEKAQGYWEQVKNKTQGWVESFKALDFNVKVRETGERAAEAMKTYATILYDQVTHSW